MHLTHRLAAKRRRLVRALACAALSWLGASPLRAEVLTTATWDTDSYVYFGTNSVTATEITLGAPVPPGVDPHYNVGFIKFDVSGLSLAGPKYLEVEPNTATAVLPSGVAVAALNGDTDGYFAAGDIPGRVAWLSANAFAQPPLTTVTISTGGKHYADITLIVNDWIANPSENYGLALWRVGGVDFDSPELFSMNDPQGRGPVINSVPEPSTLALAAAAAMLVIGVLFRRPRASAAAARPPAV
jgi:hypothetical protein